jgi:hypothetical protein
MATTAAMVEGIVVGIPATIVEAADTAVVETLVAVVVVETKAGMGP